jgi:ribonuclease P protein component
VVEQRLRPSERIRRRTDFQRTYEKGVRVSGQFGTLFLIRNQQTSGRLGIAATRKLGGAVQRNRAKRLLREVFRRNKLAPGFDIVIVARRDLLHASLSVLELEYRKLVDRARRSLAHQGL